MGVRSRRDFGDSPTMSPRRSAIPRLLSTATAADLGLTGAAINHRIERLGWQRLTRGLVLTTSEQPDRSDWIAAGLLLAGRGSAVSGWDGVRLLDRHAVPDSPPQPTVLVLSRDGKNRLIGGLRIRATRREFGIRRIFQGSDVLRVAAAPRAVADLALSGPSLAATQALVTKSIQRGLCTPRELVDELQTCPRNGSGFFRRALSDVLDGVASVAEAQAVDELRLASVPPFELNVPLVRSDGALVAVADIFWRELRAVLEVDSREFHFSETSWNRTMMRHNTLTAAGLALTHYSPARIRLGAVRHDVEPWLRARAIELGRSYDVDPRPIRPPDDVPPPFYLP